jgi:hypothetical protein
MNFDSIVTSPLEGIDRADLWARYGRKYALVGKSSGQLTHIVNAKNDSQAYAIAMAIRNVIGDDGYEVRRVREE